MRVYLVEPAGLVKLLTGAWVAWWQTTLLESALGNFRATTSLKNRILSTIYL